MAAGSKHFLSGRKVVVSGAGLAGLSFIISLFKSWDASIPPPEILVVEAQGREECIHRWKHEIQLLADVEDAALVGIREQGLLDSVMAKACLRNDESSTMHIWDKSWKSIISFKPKVYEDMPTAGIRIPHNDLLAILVAAVEAHVKISWQTPVESVERLSDGRVRVSLLDKTGGSQLQEECDLLIAADGEESIARKTFRPDDVSKATGNVFYGGFVEYGDDANIPAPVTKDFGILVGGDGVAAVLSHMTDKGKLMWLVGKEDKQPRAAYDNTDPEAFKALREEVLVASKNIAEPLASIINSTLQENSFVRPALEREPFGHDSPDLRGIIFVGEANRRISPYSGTGGSLALRDGVDLANALIREASLESATNAYDKLALARAQKATKAARDTMGAAHASGWKWTITKTALAAGGFLKGK